MLTRQTKPMTEDQIVSFNKDQSSTQTFFRRSRRLKSTTKNSLILNLTISTRLLFESLSPTGWKATQAKAKGQLITMTSSKNLLMLCQLQMPDGRQQNQVTKSWTAHDTEHFTTLTSMPFKYTTSSSKIFCSKHQRRWLS